MMNRFVLPLHAFLIFYFLVIDGANDLGFLPDHVSITCGSAETYAVSGSRTWIGDADPGLTPLVQIKGSSTTSRNGDPAPYTTARVSLSQFTYAFQLKPGPKLICLHFNPIPYLREVQDSFTVEAGNFILLTQFSASTAANAFGERFVVKQFYLNVEENKKLDIVFSADNRRAKDAYAFINGIEIIALPLHLSHFHGGGIKVVGKNYVVYIDNKRALEMIYHVRTRRNYAAADFRHTQRAGRVIDHMTWSISVDMGFSYLVRLHFCDIGLEMAEVGVMNYTVSIGDTIVASTEDEFKRRGYKGIPLYDDHMVMDKGSQRQVTTDLSISVMSNSELKNEHGPLKELELFKLSNSYNSFAKPQPMVSDENVIAILIVAVVTLVILVAHDLQKNLKAESVWKVMKLLSSIKGAKRCHRFSLAEIREATVGFSRGLILGKGGFGIVYKGFIDDGREIVAIKRLRQNSWQGEQEFQTEINMLSKVQHVNLVSLIGYCREQLELILVYEFMAGGTLFDLLFKHGAASNNHLSWKRRLNICIGAGRGLDYLHTGYGVIHRDVKTSNILLNENLMAKISDFGLAKFDGTSDQSQGYGSTVKGTLGYLDPNYTSTRKLTQKSDIYGFGIVLLEVLCRRPVMDTRVEEGKRNIATWALGLMRKGKTNQIVDPRLRQEISFNSLNVFIEIVKRCLHKDPNKRPTMAQVVQKLESALAHQEGAESLVPTYQMNTRVDKIDHPWKLLYSDLKAATDNFSRTNVIAGGISSTIIYRGKFSSGPEVSIIRFKADAYQEKTRFTSEFNFLWELFHRNLVQLVGICEQGEEYFFVYEQLKNGSLYDQLHGNNCKALDSWKLRFAILLGAARGIDYLHNGTARSIVHRHINSNNIWLDADWTARVSFYGLSIIDVDNKFHPWVVPGNDAIWYVDPESFLDHVVPKKCDVYSLGIVLLEVLTGNRAMFMFESDGGAVGNAVKAIREGNIGSILDPRVGAGKTSETRALKFVANIAVQCVNWNGKDRPDVRDVVSVLEMAMALCEGTQGNR